MPLRFARIFLSVSLGMLAAASCLAADAEYDLIIRNGHIVDGTGSPW